MQNIFRRYLATAALILVLPLQVERLRAHETRGVTVEPKEQPLCVGSEPARRIGVSRKRKPMPVSKEMERADTLWVPADSAKAWKIVPARKSAWVYYDAEEGSLQDGTSVAQPLTETAQSAVEMAPDWLKKDLADNLRRLNSGQQDRCGALVIDCHDKRFVDEVAFQVAHLSPQALSRIVKDLLVRNVEVAYQIDPELPFVEIVDYGDPVIGGDYYSTTRYHTFEAGDTVEVEIPKEIYYWWVIMPKLSDEEPSMDPSVYGYFWREYLFYFADQGYPLLREKLATTRVLWDDQIHHLPGGRDFSDSMFALDVIGNWVSETLPYAASGNRPIQPNVIAHEHNGNCGEVQDLLGAACRAAMIPVALTHNINEDHVWNEFWWDGQWHPYQVDLGGGSTHINDPYIAYDYEYGGRREVSAVWDWRGDGYQWSVVERYSDVCSLTVRVTDQGGVPVDGVLVQLHSEMCESSDIWPCFFGATDRLGQFTTALGDSQNYYIRIESGLGDYPPSGVVRIIDSADASPGCHFLWERSLPGSMPNLPAVPAETPEAASTLRMAIIARVPTETLYGRDCYNGGYDNVYARKFPVGYVDFFLVGEPGFEAYSSWDPFDAFGLMEATAGPNAEFLLPDPESNWYAVFSNEQSMVLQRIVDYDVYLYDNRAPSVGGPDTWGYRWTNSGVEEGPDFDWVDISATGTSVPMGDDDNQGPFSIGFSFPYYGESYDSLFICSNGWLSFTSESHAYRNRPIPDTRDPNALLAPFWTDLDPGSGGIILYYRDIFDQRFVVSWVGIPRVPDQGANTFQAILHEDGTILFQYENVSPWEGVPQCTAGIESPDGSFGLQYFLDGSPNENQLRDALAVRFYRLDRDVGPIRAHSPISSLFPGVPVTPSVTVKSSGLEQVSFEVVCSIVEVDGGNLVYQDTAQVLELSYLEKRQVPFPSCWTPDHPGTYATTFRTLLSEDQDPSNNIISSGSVVDYVADMAYDDGSPEDWYITPAGPTIPKAMAVWFETPFPQGLIHSGKILTQENAPFDAVYLCPSDAAGHPDLENWYACDSLVSAQVEQGWAWASLPHQYSNKETLWVVACWGLGASEPHVGVDLDAPNDGHSWFGRPDIGMWRQYDHGDLMVRLESQMPASAHGAEPLALGVVRLLRVGPNPLSSSATVCYHVAPGLNGKQRHVSVRIYDMLGRLIAMPIDHESVSGTQRVTWHFPSHGSERVPPGSYILRLEADNPLARDTMRLIVIP